MSDSTQVKLKVPQQVVDREEAKEVASKEVSIEASVAFPTYGAKRLNQFMLNDGTVVKPLYGIYTADTEEKFNLLNYYVSCDKELVIPLF